MIKEVQDELEDYIPEFEGMDADLKEMQTIVEEITGEKFPENKPKDKKLSESTPTLSCSHHDYKNPKRLGRARYHCPKCGADISMEVILIAIAELESEENENFWES